MKKFLAMIPVGGFALASVAAEAGAAVAYEGSVAETIATNASATLTNFLTGVGPVVAGMIVAGLAIWGGISIVGTIKRGFSAGKGR